MSERDDRNREPEREQPKADAERLPWPATLPPPSKHPPHMTTRGSLLPVAIE